MISMIPKLCPQFVADIVSRAANDHAPAKFKLLTRPLIEQRGHHLAGRASSRLAGRLIDVHNGQDWAPTPGNENALVTVREAEQMLRCCKTTVNTLINAGKLERVKIGRATRITVRSIRAMTGVP